MLNQKKVIIIYVIRDFESWLPSHINNRYETSFNGDIISSTYEWPSMNVYELYCYMINKNLNLLKNSESNYVIVNMKKLQKSNGYDLIKLLKDHNLDFSKEFIPVLKHTKNNENKQNRDYNKVDINYYKKKSNKEIDDYVSSLTMEYRLNL